MKAPLGWCRHIVAAGLFFVLAHAMFGQGVPPGQVSLALSSGSASLSGAASLNLNIAAAPGSEPAGIQWSLTYPPGDVASVSVVAGPALTANGKSVYCNGRVGVITCLGVGLNANPIGTGVAAVVTLSLAQATDSSLLPISIGATFAVLSDGTTVTAYGTGGTVTVAGWKPTVPAYFTDVATTDPDYAAVNLLYAKGISKGCSASPLLFCPDRNLTRGEMATLLIRAVGGDPTSFNPTPYFADVPPDHPFFAWIQKLYELHITNGCANSPLKFCPDRPVTRGEIAALNTNGRYGPTETFTNSLVPYFTDVPATDIFFSSIQKMSELGVRGCGPLLFCSTNDATRREMAAFLVRGLLNELLPVGTPVLSAASVSVVYRGSTPVMILVFGANTHFTDGLTLDAGAGITVSGVTALDSQTVAATLSVSPSAVPGPRSLVVRAGPEEAVLPNGLTVQ